MADRRRFGRVAPTGLTLVLKPHGWLSMFSRNLALHWIDVSEGGIGVLVSRKLKLGERFRAFVEDRYYRDAFDVTVEVRHVRESQTMPGRYVVGLEFVDPIPVMRTCIRSLVDTGWLPQRSLVTALKRVG